MKKVIMSLLLTVAVSYGMAFAQSTKSSSNQYSSKKLGKTMVQDETGWQKIGEKTIDLSKGSGELDLKMPEKFSALRIKSNQTVNLKDLQVIYDSGDNQEVPLETPIMANTESPVFNLNSADRSLKKIVFDVNNSGIASTSSPTSITVEVYGLKSSTSTK